MEDQTDHPTEQTPSVHASAQGSLLIRDAAAIIGVSQRSIYGYIKAGKLTGGRVGNSIVVSTEEVSAYQRSAPGRRRIITPRWHRAPARNQLSLTTITAQVRPGQGEALEAKLDAIL